MEMTAERSLEIITKQITQSRKTVSKEAGFSLFVSGACIIGIAILVSICASITNNAYFYLLYALTPILIIGIDRYAKRNQPKVPVSFVGTMVDKTWQTFGIFALSFCVLSILFNKLMLMSAETVNNMEVFHYNKIHIFRIILLLMGMAITINGYILKSRWLVWCGIIGGIVGFFWQSIGVTDFFLTASNLPLNYRMAIHYVIGPNLIVVFFAFIGLMLPGWMLKRQK